MKSTHKKHSLLDILQQLYDVICRQLLRRQRDTYHQQTSGTAELDVLETLSDYLDKLRASHTVNQQSINISTIYRTATKLTVRHNDDLLQAPSLIDSELARYFRSKSTGSSLHPYLSEKLKESTIENIHTSIRFARLGDSAIAKLHMDIARYAIAELGHYLTTVEYGEFMAKIKDNITYVATYVTHSVPEGSETQTG